MKIEHISKRVMTEIKSGLVEHISKIKDKDFNGAQVQLIEKDFYKLFGKSARCGISELLFQNDITKKYIILDGKKYYFKYKSIGKYLTLLGEVAVKRSIYQSNKSSISYCPLESRLMFVNDYVSFAATEYISYTLASMTPSEFVKHCKKWTLMKPSISTVKRVINYVGKFMETNDFIGSVQCTEQVPIEAKILAISIDATSVLVKKEGWRQATAGTISVYNKDGDRLNTTYIGRMPEKSKIKIKRALVNEVESIVTRQKFEQIVCIADGAVENWIFFRKKFPNAVHITDFFHVAEHLSKLSELLFKKAEEAKVWYDKYRTILKNDPNGATKTIRAARYRCSLINTKNTAIGSEIKYLQHNRKRMNYFEYKQKNLPIGSGVVEAACKNLIGARLKKSGMSWTIEGGQHILSLRSLVLSNRWDKFWDYFLKFHFSNNVM